ncbi:MAG TPA: type II toxin-antitoxin system VapC family toxin [Terriglobales bacterium]|nr:type II toxin-antitoxin system VapC family toxin [Terriglobales bacterium]
MIVVDTNILMYACVDNPLSPAAEKLRNLDPIWTAPALWRSEMRNALAGEMRSRGLVFEDALRVLDKAEGMVQTLAIEAHGEIMQLVSLTLCSAYDLEFVVLARRLSVNLITMDRQLLQAFPGLARPLP